MKMQINKGKILVTPRSLSKSGHPFLERLREAGYEVIMPFPGVQPSIEELSSVLPECAGYLAGVEKVSAEVLKKCDKLRVISRNGVGIDNVDARAAGEMGISLQVARGANSRGVAELAITLMLTLLRDISSTNSSVKNGGWHRTKGFEVDGRTLGIIGTGQIGQYTAKMAAGLDMKIIAYDPYPTPELPERIPGFSYESINVLFSSSDIISLHCPAGSIPLINSETLGLCRKGTYLINTARSALVDQNALLSALDKGIIAGYAVDAFDSEPPELSPLLKHDKVILTSHIGGFTAESIDRATEAAVKNLLDNLD